MLTTGPVEYKSHRDIKKQKSTFGEEMANIAALKIQKQKKTTSISHPAGWRVERFCGEI